MVNIKHKQDAVSFGCARLMMILNLCFCRPVSGGTCHRMALLLGYFPVFIPWLAWVVTANGKTIPVWTWLDGSLLVNQSNMLSLHTAGKQYPGCRADSAVWTDTNSGVMWMFGGKEGSGSALDELWGYTMSSQEWTYYVSHDRENHWPRLRYGPAICGVAGSFIVIHGGAESAKNLLSDTWLYHLHNQSWKLLSDDSGPGAQFNMVHWCTDNALWLWTFKEATFDPKKSVTMWRFSLLNYEWNEVDANFDDDRSGREETHIDGQRHSSTTWVVNNTELYLLVGKASNIGHVDGETCQGKNHKTSTECDLWRFSTVSSRWQRISIKQKTAIGDVIDSDLIELNVAPACPADGASWQDTDSNLWLLGGTAAITDTCGKLHHPRSDLWMFDLTHGRWEHFKSLTSPEYQLGYEIVEGAGDVRNHPGPRAFCASWSWNNTYYLFGGLSRNGTDRTFNDLWSFQLIDEQRLKGKPTSTLAVSPVGVFFLSLGALCFLALVVFSIIFFSKCSTGPRLKPPNHFGDKIRYSPVETDEVFIT